jgi:hypothetical protein
VWALFYFYLIVNCHSNTSLLAPRPAKVSLFQTTIEESFMKKLLAVLAALTFTLGSASGFAADAVKKKEELTAEQKTEIRDRVERMKADRAKADQAKTTPGAPAKKADPKRTS